VAKKGMDLDSKLGPNRDARIQLDPGSLGTGAKRILGVELLAEAVGHEGNKYLGLASWLAMDGSRLKRECVKVG
jgi:hypothetical protein